VQQPKRLSPAKAPEQKIFRRYPDGSVRDHPPEETKKIINKGKKDPHFHGPQHKQVLLAHAQTL